MIRLTETNGSPVYLNHALISAVQPTEMGNVRIYCERMYWIVTEPLEHVVALLAPHFERGQVQVLAENLNSFFADAELMELVGEVVDQIKADHAKAKAKRAP